MSQYDNNMKGALWPNVSDNPKAPKYKGNVTIKGVMYDLALWPNGNDNPKAPDWDVKVAEMVRTPTYTEPQEREAPQPVATQSSEDISKDIPF